MNKWFLLDIIVAISLLLIFAGFTIAFATVDSIASTLLGAATICGTLLLIIRIKEDEED
jgi:hypothetical protein